MDWAKIEDAAKAGLVIALITFAAVYVTRRALKA